MKEYAFLAFVTVGKWSCAVLAEILRRGLQILVAALRIVETFGTPDVAALVECWLETGRTHQIRVHMAHAGHSLIGDQTYGGRRKLSEKTLGIKGVNAAKSFERQALHAAVLGFVHPVSGEEMRFEAPLPSDMAALIEAMRAGAGN